MTDINPIVPIRLSDIDNLLQESIFESNNGAKLVEYIKNRRPGRGRIRLHNLFDPAMNRPQFNFDLDNSDPQPLQDTPEGDRNPPATSVESVPSTSGNSIAPAAPENATKQPVIVVQSDEGVREVSSSTSAQPASSSCEQQVVAANGSDKSSKTKNAALAPNLSRTILINQLQRNNAAKCDLLRTLASSTPKMNSNFLNSRISNFTTSISPIPDVESPAPMVTEAPAQKVAEAPVLVQDQAAKAPIPNQRKSVALVIAPCSQPLEAPARSSTPPPTSKDVVIPETPSPLKPSSIVESPKAPKAASWKPRRLSATIQEMTAAGLLDGVHEDACITSDESQPINNSVDDVLLKSILKDPNSTQNRRSMRVSFSNRVHEREISPAPTIEGDWSSGGSSNDSDELDNDIEEFQVVDEVYSDDNSGDNSRDYDEYEFIRKQIEADRQNDNVNKPEEREQENEIHTPSPDDYHRGISIVLLETDKKDNKTCHQVLDIVTDWDDEDEAEGTPEAEAVATDITYFEIPETQRSERVTICDARDISSSNIEESTERQVDLPPPPDEFRDVTVSHDAAPIEFGSSAKRRFMRENDEAVISRLQSELPELQLSYKSSNPSPTCSEAAAEHQDKVSDTLVEIAQSFRDNPVSVMAPPPAVDSMRKTIIPPKKSKRLNKNQATESYFKTVETTIAKPSLASVVNKKNQTPAQKRKLYVQSSNESIQNQVDLPPAQVKPVIKPLKVLIPKLRYEDYCSQKVDSNPQLDDRTSLRLASQIASCSSSPESTTPPISEETSKPTETGRSTSSSSDENIVTSSSSEALNPEPGAKRRFSQTDTPEDPTSLSDEQAQTVAAKRVLRSKHKGSQEENSDDQQTPIASTNEDKQPDQNDSGLSDTSPQNQASGEELVRKVRFGVLDDSESTATLTRPSTKPKPMLTPYVCKKMRAKLPKEQTSETTEEIPSEQPAVEEIPVQTTSSERLVSSEESQIPNDNQSSPDQSGQVVDIPIISKSVEKSSCSSPKIKFKHKQVGATKKTLAESQPAVDTGRPETKEAEPTLPVYGTSPEADDGTESNEKISRDAIRASKAKPKLRPNIKRNKKDHREKPQSAEHTERPNETPTQTTHSASPSNSRTETIEKLRDVPSNSEQSGDTTVQKVKPKLRPRKLTRGKKIYESEEVDETRTAAAEAHVESVATESGASREPVELQLVAERLAENATDEGFREETNVQVSTTERKKKLRPKFTGSKHNHKEREPDPVDSREGAVEQPKVPEGLRESASGGGSDCSKAPISKGKKKLRPKFTKSKSNHRELSAVAEEEPDPDVLEEEIAEQPKVAKELNDDASGGSKSSKVKASVISSKSVRFADDQTERSETSSIQRPRKDIQQETQSTMELIDILERISPNAATTGSSGNPSSHETLQTSEPPTAPIESLEVACADLVENHDEALSSDHGRKKVVRPTKQDYIEKHTIEKTEKEDNKMKRKFPKCYYDSEDEKDEWLPPKRTKKMKEKANTIRRELDRNSQSDDSEPRRSKRTRRIATHILMTNPLVKSAYDQPNYKPMDLQERKRAEKLALELQKRASRKFKKAPLAKSTASSDTASELADPGPSAPTGRKRNPSPQEASNTKRSRYENDSGVAQLEPITSLDASVVPDSLLAEERSLTQNWMMRLLRRDSNTPCEMRPAMADPGNFVHMTLDNLGFREHNGIQYSFFQFPEEANCGFLRFKEGAVKRLTKSANCNLKFLVMNGELTFEVNGKTSVGQAGDFLIIPADSKYSIRNGAGKSLLFMVKQPTSV